MNRTDLIARIQKAAEEAATEFEDGSYSLRRFAENFLDELDRDGLEIVKK